MEKEDKPALVRRSDFVIAAAVLLAAALAFALFSQSGAKIAVISHEGTTVKLELSARREETLSVGDTVIEMKDGGVYFKESSCGDKTCVKTGALPDNGSFAACLPNGVYIQLEDGAEFDAFAY